MFRRALAVMAATVLVLGVALPASAASPPGRSGQHAPLYYLSVGDSLSAGVQPTGDPADMYRTNEGYADQLFALMKPSVPNLQLVKLGCPGETTATMIDGGICPYDHGSQLAEAVSFLHAHHQFVALVTIDIGFNDFPCQTDLSCVPPGVARIQQNLPIILAALREAAGPDVPIIGMTVYDPFLGYWLTGAEGKALAELTLPGILAINDVLRGIYTAAGSPVADVESAFSTTDFVTQVALPGVGPVPLNVARICQWTWICAPPPLGPNNHANSAGYAAIAQAFFAALQ